MGTKLLTLHGCGSCGLHMDFIRNYVTDIKMAAVVWGCS